MPTTVNIFFRCSALQVFLLFLNLKYICTAVTVDTVRTETFIATSTSVIQTFREDVPATFSKELDVAYFSSDESKLRCARRCMSDKRCDAFDVNQNVHDVTTPRCALRHRKVNILFALSYFLFKYILFYII